MKKVLLSALAVLALAVCSLQTKAQLPDYSYAPDWTVTDMNGNTHNMYSYLDSGYTVIIDMFATWCVPCWNYHQQHVLENVHQTYGPNGTNEIRVFGLESDGTTPDSEMFGGGTSVGDWMNGINYPMVSLSPAEASSIAQNDYNLAYYPTIYMVCPDRTVREVGQLPSPADHYAASQECAGVATNPLDPALLVYTGDEISYCGDFDASVTMQNHGTSPLTSATIEILEGTTVIETYNWTGNLPTYQITTINIPGVTATGGADITVKISSTNDDLSNDVVDANLEIVAESTPPYDQSNESSTTTNELADGVYQAEGTFTIWTIQPTSFVTPVYGLGAYGNSDKSLFWYFYNYSTGNYSSVIFDKMDLTEYDSAAIFEFSHAYAQYSSENDKLEVLVSSDCGQTWTNEFEKAGSDLSTTNGAPVTTLFIPEDNQWTTNSVDLSSYLGKTILIKMKGTSAYGNNLYVDDISMKAWKDLVPQVTIGGVEYVIVVESNGDTIYVNGNDSFELVNGNLQALSVQDLTMVSEVELYPNPANNLLNVTLSANATDHVTFSIMDVTGRVVLNQSTNVAPGQNNLQFRLDNLAAGTYQLSIKSQDGLSMQKKFLKQ